MSPLPNLPRPRLLASLALALALAPPAEALPPRLFELEQARRSLALEQAKAEALEALAERRVEYFQEWIQWWRTVDELVGARQQHFRKQLEERKKQAQEILALVQSLQAGEPSSVQVPGAGRVKPAQARELVQKAKDEVAALQKAIQEGKDRWWVVTVSWITSGEVRGRITGLEEQIEQTRASVEDGTFHATFSGFRTLRLKRVRASIAALEARIQGLVKAGEEGTYEVQVPGYGRTTRRKLDADIAAAEAALEELRETYERQQLSTWRLPYGHGHVTEAQVAEGLAKSAESFETMKKLVGDGLYKVWFKRDGDQTRTSLEERIASLDEELARVQQQVRDGTYEVGALGYRFTRTQAEDEIARIEERLDAPSLDPKVRATLTESLGRARRVLAAIPEVSAYDLARMGLEKTTLGAQVAFLMKLAEPDFAHRKLTRSQQESWRSEFAENYELRRKHMEARLEHMRRAREVFFGDA